MAKNILFVGVFCVLFVLWLRYFEWRSIFFPTREISETPQALNLAYEEIFFKTEDGVGINAWFIPVQHPLENQKKRQYAVLFCHGNGGNISHRMEKIAMFHGLGFSVFIYDYRGYGKSEGRASEQGMYRDTRAAYEYLLKQKAIVPEALIVYGESLGAAAAVDLVAQTTVAALILEGAFSRAQDMAKELYPFLPGFVIQTKLDSLSKISNVSCPLLFIHSEGDEIVPIELAHKLYNQAREPKTFLAIEGDHNFGVINFQDKVIEGIRAFVDSL